SSGLTVFKRVIRRLTTLLSADEASLLFEFNSFLVLIKGLRRESRKARRRRGEGARIRRVLKGRPTRLVFPIDVIGRRSRRRRERRGKRRVFLVLNFLGSKG